MTLADSLTNHVIKRMAVVLRPYLGFRVKSAANDNQHGPVPA